jgi:hypothetical protein
LRLPACQLRPTRHCKASAEADGKGEAGGKDFPTDIVFTALFQAQDRKLLDSAENNSEIEG